MKRADFHTLFKVPGPVVLPVIHVLDKSRTLENVEVLVGEGAAGCFLINHDFGIEPFLPIIHAVRRAFPALWMGVNFLAVTGRGAFPELARLQNEGCGVAAYWADDACIDESRACQTEAQEIDWLRKESGWRGLYFGGTAFKKQRAVAPSHYAEAALKASAYMDVVTTSGVATGKEADLSKIEAFRAGVGDRPMALASGITPDNAEIYRDVDCFMVATGINKDGNFYDIDATKLARLMRITEQMGRGKLS